MTPSDEETAREEEPRRRLAIYLDDHRAGAAAGIARAQRCANGTDDTALARYLRDTFLPQTIGHREALDAVRQRVESDTDAFGTVSAVSKVAVARLGELLGRVKTNGSVLHRSPSTDVVEVEALLAGVHAQERLLATLTALGEDVDQLRAECEAQLDALGAHHIRVVGRAF